MTFLTRFYAAQTFVKEIDSPLPDSLLKLLNYILL